MQRLDAALPETPVTDTEWLYTAKLNGNDYASSVMAPDAAAATKILERMGFKNIRLNNVESNRANLAVVVQPKDIADDDMETEPSDDQDAEEEGGHIQKETIVVGEHAVNGAEKLLKEGWQVKFASMHPGKTGAMHYMFVLRRSS